MKNYLLGSMLMLACASAHAQDSKWTMKGMLGASYNATDVSENWSGAEKNSQSWGVKLDASAERDSARTNWITTLKEEYGTTKIAGSIEQTNADIIDLSSVYTRKLSFYVNPYASAIVNTQHWRILNPVTYTESIGNGIWLINRPNQQLKTRAGIAFKQLFDPVRTVIDPVTGAATRISLADDPKTPDIEESRHDTGGEWITNYDFVLNESAKFVSEARVFSAFKGGASLRWDNSLFVKLSKYFTLQLNYLWIYAFDQTPQPVWPQDVQKRLTLTMGFSYNIF